MRSMNQLDEEQIKKIAGYLGIAQKAGRIAAGDNNVREAFKKKKIEDGEEYFEFKEAYFNSNTFTILNS